MTADFWAAAVEGLAVVLFGSLLLEALLIPRPRLKDRPLAAWAMHGGICLLTYDLELILFQRAGFGVLMALSTLLLLVVVSRVKMRLLREPFLFQDFEYFTDLLRHPRLYLPFFGIWNAVAGLGAFIVAVYLGMAAEPNLVERGGWANYLAALVVLGGVGWGLLCIARRSPPLNLSFNPAEDLHALGFLAYLGCYGLAERKPIPPIDNGLFSSDPKSVPSSDLPHLVVVQSESFFDARRLYPAIKPEVLAEFDQIRAASLKHGLLSVPAWGANTVRSEFAFLSGLTAQAMGVHRFNPYRKLARTGVATLASYLKGLGYRTVGIHPYWLSFYDRDKIYPRMGFDSLIGLEAFSQEDRFGPYVGDVAVGRKVRELLEEATTPLFIFIITMENHGPLHWESVSPADEAQLYHNPPPKGYEDLTVYLRHLLNADRLSRDLQKSLQESPRKGVYCWYGDHVPILENIYADQGFDDGRTDYFIWRQGGEHTEQPASELSVEQLPAALLAAMGLGRVPGGPSL